MLPNLNDNQAQSRIREEDLIEPSLLILAKAERGNHGPITTAQLKAALKATLPLSDEDQAPLKNRSDTKIDQIIRNLVSHRTLTRKELVHQEDGKFSITEAGKAVVLDAFLNMLPMPSLEVTRKASVSNVSEAAELDQAGSEPTAPRRRRSGP